LANELYIITSFVVHFSYQMPLRINIQPKTEDARGRVRQKVFQSLGLSGKLTQVSIVDSYSTDARLTPKQAAAAVKLLTNKILEKGSIKTLAPKKFNWAIEISFLPGVTDNVGNTAKETLEDGLKKKFKPNEGVYSSQVLFLAGKLTENDVKKIADSLYNPLIQKVEIKDFKVFRKQKGFGPNIPKVHLASGQKVLTVNLNIPDEELAVLGRQGILDPQGFRRGPLSLDVDSLKVIRNYFHKLGRKPTDAELESLAQTWSEHCKHTIFADPLDELDEGIYKTYIKRATETVRKQKGKDDFCVSVFKDNSGGIDFDENFLVTHKVETHNSPSALDPFGGAITGIVGVNRDALGFGKGAKPVINFYGYCFADPRDKSELYRDQDKIQKMLSAKRIMEGVIAGVNAGGNQSGIPTPQGFLCFDPRFRGKPLVFVGTVGLIPKKIHGKPGHEKRARPGDLIVMAGGRVGLDGIHGATFSSETLSSGSPATAVQIGDPITQKKMSDALVKEARDLELYDSITDDGAGGLSSSVAEMAEQSGGCEVNLDKVPVKYPGLQPWQIWISESQERMTLAVPPKKWKKFARLMKKRGVEATVIGKFTDSGKCIVKYGRKTVIDLDMDFLHNGRPIKYQVSSSKYQTEKQAAPVPSKNDDTDRSRASSKIFQSFNLSILNLLRQPNIASFGFISEQYDHEVQGGSVTKPLQGRGRVNADASVTRPVLDSKKGVVLSQGILPWYSDISTYHMAAAAIDTAIRAAVAAGADPDKLALLDNFCWYSGNEPESLAKLKDAAKACYDYAVAFGAPFISGKDSMFNDFKGFDEKGKPVKISVPPTLLISAIGVMDDAEKAVTIDAKFADDAIYLLGETNNELGASEYEKMMNMDLDTDVPHVNAAKNLKLYRALSRAIKKEMLASAISLGRGGLAVALAKTAMAGELGVNVDLGRLPGNAKEYHHKLFSESQGRILVTVNPKFTKEFEKLMQGNPIARIGSVTEKKEIAIKDENGKKIADVKLSDALKAYRETFKDY